MLVFLLMFFEKLATVYCSIALLISILVTIIELLYPGDPYTGEKKQTAGDSITMIIIISLFWPLFIKTMFKGLTRNIH